MRVALVTLAALVGLTACGAGGRPDPDRWAAGWERVRDAVAGLVDDTGAVRVDRCEDVLELLRDRRGDLLPSPDEGLDDPVRRWVEVSEALAFDCQRHPDPAGATEELAVLAAEIDAGLRRIRASGRPGEANP